MQHSRLHNLLENLAPLNLNNGAETVQEVTKPLKILIAKNHAGHPSIFFKTIATKKSSITDLKYLTIEIGDIYELKIKGKRKFKDTFSKITLTSTDPVLLRIFSSAISSLVNLISLPATDIVFEKDFFKLIEIFRSLDAAPSKTISGLWAELFLIQESGSVPEALKYWHQSPNAKYDFSQQNIHLEVKSTNSDIREHHFSLAQAHPQKGNICVVASVLLNDDPRGANINDLLNRIKSKLSRFPELKMKLDIQVATLLGEDLLRGNSYKFNLPYSRKNLKFYELDGIPKIDSSYLKHPQISKISFVSNLEAETTITKSYKNIKKNIFKTIVADHLDS